MQQGSHTHSITGLESGSFDTKKFMLSVEAHNQEEALHKLSEAIHGAREAGIQFKESTVTVGTVTANYFYPYRPHC